MQFLGTILIAAVVHPAQAEPAGADTPDGSSVPKTPSDGWSAPVAWGDVDGDGRPDLFVAGGGGADRLYLADGAGGFDLVHGDFAPAHSARGGLFEDLDGDGVLDLVTIDVDGAARLHRGAGSALFEEPVQVPIHGGHTGHAGLTRARLFDFDGDGRADLFAETSPGQPALFHRHGSFAFAPVALEGEEVASPSSPDGAQAPHTPGEDAAAPAAAPLGGGASGPGGAGRKPLLPPSAASSNGSGGTGVSSSPGGLAGEAGLPGLCTAGIEDLAFPGVCLSASSVPTLGALYPLSSDLFVDSSSGYVGIGTTTPTERLSVKNGDLEVEGGDAHLYDAFGNLRIRLDSSENGTGSQLQLYNGSSGVTVELDADNGGSGDGFLAVSNQNLDDTIFLDGGQVDDGGEITIANSSADPTLVLDGDNAGSGAASVSMFDRAGSEMLSLRGDNGNDAGRIKLNHSLGGNTIQIDAGSPAFGSFMWFRNGPLQVEIDGGDDGGGEISVYSDIGVQTVLLDGEEGDGGSVRLFNDAGLQTVDIDGDDTGDARVVLSNEFGSSKITFDAGASDDGADVTYEAADDSNTIFFDADADNNGGILSVRNDTSEETVRIIGDDGDDAGEILLYDRNGSNNHTGAQLQARLASAGGELALYNNVGGLAFSVGRATGNSDSGPVLLALQGDGNLELSFFDNLLALYDDNSNATITYDGETGSKNAVMQTASYGQRLLYVMESPEIWFEDFGTGQLVDGSARIDLDPVFLETVTIDESQPMKVYVTPTGKSRGLWVVEGPDHFVVHELDGGDGDATFDWRLVAKRRGLEDARLEPFADPALTYPMEALRASRGAPSFTDVDGEALDDPVEHAPAPEAAKKSRSKSQRAPRMPVEGAAKSSKKTAEGS